VIIVIMENDVVLNIQKQIMQKNSIMLVIKQNFKNRGVSNVFFFVSFVLKTFF